ncbi:MAG TPA: AMP-binding protein, partial [Acidimicrobiales bacterium]|nr:AMP-binding protein [Acidimicrobiales bacterium]
LERAERAGILSWRSYGSTEHPSVSSGGPLDPVEVRHRTDGSVGDGVEVRIVDEDRHDLPAGEPGEILVRGPKLFVGYRDATLDADAFAPGGWFRTGDIGRLDAEGHLVITDRIKDIIIRGGENIASKEVEDVLADHPAVAEVAVVAQPDPALGEIVAAVVRLVPGWKLDLDDVTAHFRSAGVPRHKVPEALHVIDDFPRTAAGKVRKPDLRAQLAGA